MDLFKHYSIHRQLMATSLLASAVALIMAASAFMIYDVLSYRQTLVKAVSGLSEIVGINAASSVVFNDKASATKTLAALKARANVVSAAIYLPAGNLFAEWQRTSGTAIPQPPAKMETNETHDFRSGALVLFHPIALDNTTIGTVMIETDLSSLVLRLRGYAGIVVLVLGVSLLVAGWIAQKMGRKISSPILHLVDVAQTISDKKDYSARAEDDSQGEMGLLIKTFNGMLNKIQDDAREIRRLNEELERKVQLRTAELTHANKELEAFSYSVSHDLRAPLRHIGGFTDLLLKNPTLQNDPTAKRYLTMVVESVTQMGVLIDDLLSFSRMGRAGMKQTKLDLNDLVQNIVSELEPQGQGRDVDWRVAPLPEIDGDPALIRVAFVNLLSNALKYSRQRKRAVIEVGAEPGPDGKPIVFVRDNGAGFDMKYADKLFGVFQRLHSSDDFEGTGIGLATVQRVIHRHGGKIWAQAEVDKGATFYVAFP